MVVDRVPPDLNLSPFIQRLEHLMLSNSLPVCSRNNLESHFLSACAMPSNPLSSHSCNALKPLVRLGNALKSPILPPSSCE